MSILILGPAGSASSWQLALSQPFSQLSGVFATFFKPCLTTFEKAGPEKPVQPQKMILLMPNMVLSEPRPQVKKNPKKNKHFYPPTKKYFLEKNRSPRVQRLPMKTRGRSSHR